MGSILADLRQYLNGIDTDDGAGNVHQLEGVRTNREDRTGPGFLPGQGGAVLVDSAHLDIVDVDVQVAAVDVAGVGQDEL